MLPKKRRIGKKMFPSVFSRGRVFHSPLFTARVFFDAEGGGPATFAFVVSRKVARTAVERNTLRRHGYAAIKKYICDARPGFSCVFFFKKNAGGAPLRDIEENVRMVLRNARVIP